MNIPNFKTELTVQPDAKWQDVFLFREVGYSYACLPPPGIPSEEEAIRELVKLDPRIRPLWLTKAIQKTTGGYEKHVFACVGFQGDAGFKSTFPEEYVDLPPRGIGACGLIYKNPIWVTSILDGLEQIVMLKGCPPKKAEAAAQRLRQQGAIGEFVSLASCVEEARRKVWALNNRSVEKHDDAKYVQRLAKQAQAEQKDAEYEAAKEILGGITYADKEDHLQRNPTIFQVGEA